MRYIEFKNGDLLIAPRQANTHKDMLRMSGVSWGEVVSAGFLGARYDANEAWRTFGESVGLKIRASNKPLVVPQKLYVGKHHYGLLFATNREHLKGLSEVKVAKWGFTLPSYHEDVCPVYAPLHPQHPLRADAVLCD